MNRNRKALGQIAKETWGMLLLSLAVCLFVEFFNHRTAAKLLVFLREYPGMFLINVHIIFNSFLFAEIWRRRTGARIAILILWVVLGIANYMVATYRVQPFTTRDILLIRDGLKMITAYFSWPEIILMFGGGGLAAALVVFVLARSPKRARFNRPMSFGVFVLWTAMTLIAGKVLLEIRAVDWQRTNLVAAYRDYGFAYSFTYTAADLGIPRPSEYSEELVEEIGVDIADPDVPIVVEPEKTLSPGKAPEGVSPNIVFLQMESVFDVNSVLGVEFSENPIPVLTELMEQWPSAQLKVLSVGGGTANTEFEVLSGMNLDYFGAGEFPYNTILMDTTCETVCFNLKPLGYTATAIHNYTGTFYGRNTVYAQLGFDRFAPLEYMNGLVFNELMWARDEVLTGEILKSIETTEGRDFVFAVTVQSHGKYPTTPMEGLDKIDVLECPEPIHPMVLKNYVNEVHQVDAFLGELVAALEALDEPTVLVLYGDHLPALGIEDEQLRCGDMYQTSYVLWNNFGMELEARDLQAYQLSAHVLKQLGVENGALMRFHQRFGGDDGDEQYLALLRVLEYDMLYGDLAIYEGSNPYQPTALEMGVTPILATAAEYDLSAGTLHVYGENFTPYSDIALDGVRLNAMFVDPTHLIARTEAVLPASEIRVGQYTRENELLGQTNIVKLAEN